MWVVVAVISVSPGYDTDYLLKEVATGRENYYTGAVAEGEPPGRWWGAGAADFGLAGEVESLTMKGVYERFLDPRAEGFDNPERWDEIAASATLGHAGRAYKDAVQLYDEAIEREPDADAERRDQLRVEAGKAARQNVAFLDATFSVQKSVSILHTAFEAEEIKARAAGLYDEAATWRAARETVEAAIWKANNAALEFMQAEAGYSRVGHHGGAAGRWIDAHTWTVASFFQHDSRDHDPQLHIHNTILNRVRGADGKWRTLDSRTVYRLRPAAGAIADRVLDETLAAELWVTLARRPDGKAREVAEVRPEAREMFSSRERAISARAAELIAGYEAGKGREATGLERDRIRREATLSTRAAKSHIGETRSEFVARVDGALRAEIDGGLTAIAHAARAARHGRDATGPEAGRWSPGEVVADAIEALQARKPSFTRFELMREIDAHLPDHLGLSDPRDVTELLSRLADEGIAEVERVKKVQARVAGDEQVPAQWRREDGSSQFDAPGGGSYVTHAHLRGENRLRAATEPRDGQRLTTEQAAAFVERLRGEGIELGVDQAAALTGVLTSGARLETLIGPAGTGKSFVVGSLARAWSDPAHLPDGEAVRRVFGLATSQVATGVLADEGLTAANTAAWLATQARLTRARQHEHGAGLREGDEGWSLRCGDVVVVDESSMADTAALLAVWEIVEAAGAKMLLVGDHRQLTAVGAGGAMELVAEAGARYELAEARRFTNPWEREASLRLRDGDPDVVAEYHRHGRLLDAGTVADAEASASRAWLADTLAGKRSLLVVDTNDAAARCSETIRAELVRLGRVHEQGVLLRDKTIAGVGDVVQGRRLAWELAGVEGNRRGAINREHYRVLAVRDDGALVVEVLARGDHFLERSLSVDGAGATRGGEAGAVRERRVLPPSYVANDTTLAYASTEYAVQGANADTSHTVATDHTSVNGLYTGGSRGQTENTFHVVTVTGPADVAHGGPARSVTRDPRAVVSTILETRDASDAANRSATAAIEDSADWAGSAQTLAERFAEGAHEAARERTVRWLDELTRSELLGPVERARIAAEDGTPDVTRALRQVELAGRDARDALREAIAGREFDGARRVADVLVGRLHDAGRAAGGFEPTADTWTQRVPVDVDPEWAAYLHPLAEATDTRAARRGAELADAPPVWALDVLGPVPPTAGIDTTLADGSADGRAVGDRDARARWEASAGAIEVHREMRGVTPAPPATAEQAAQVAADHQAATERAAHYGSDAAEQLGIRTRGVAVDAADVLGEAPNRGQVEAYSAYRTAHRAGDLPEYTRDALEHSEAWHRAVVAHWTNVKQWGPAYVENHLAGTRQAEQHARQRAELARAEAHAAEQRGDHAARDKAARDARHADALADTLAGQVDVLEHASQTRGRWLADTALTRAHSDQSESWLAARRAGSPAEPAVTGAEWLALDRAARAEDDPHREITDTDLTTTDDTGAVGGTFQDDDAADDVSRSRPASNETPDHGDATEDERQVEPADTSTTERTEVEPDRADDAAREPERGDERDEDADAAPEIREAPAIDEDTVHAPEPDELDAVTSTARAVNAQLREWREREAEQEQHEYDQRAEQLTRWHDDDQAAAETDSDADTVADAGDGATEGWD